MNMKNKLIMNSFIFKLQLLRRYCHPVYVTNQYHHQKSSEAPLLCDVLFVFVSVHKQEENGSISHLKNQCTRSVLFRSILDHKPRRLKPESVMEEFSINQMFERKYLEQYIISSTQTLKFEDIISSADFKVEERLRDITCGQLCIAICLCIGRL